MKKVFIISKLELLKMSRNQIVWFVCILSTFLLILMDMFNYFTIEEQLKMIQDFAFGLMNIITLIIVVYLPVNLVKDDFSEKTIYTLLSTPINRNILLFGKILAIIILIAFSLALNTCSLIIMLYFKGGTISFQIFMAVSMIFLKNLTLVGYAFLFSVLPFSNIICTILTFFVYCIGSIKSYFITNLEDQIPLYVQIMQKTIFVAVPNFRIFDVVENITLGRHVTFEHLYNSFLHFLGISIIVYAFTCYFFNKKEL
ncbi:hypothetical protein BVX93_01930 [bacterium B13(2017)]|nr:hypothetical protein BVX93_01930 [bacterium B13(2017)]